jgi:hypothetical protein
MSLNPISELTWSPKACGRRVSTSEFPYFALAERPDTHGGDAPRRRHIADLAGL